MWYTEDAFGPIRLRAAEIWKIRGLGIIVIVTEKLTRAIFVTKTKTITNETRKPSYR